MNNRNILVNYVTVNLYLLLLAVIPVILVSCEKEVILDLPDKEGLYLIVEANIDDTYPEQWIRLSNSSSYYDISKGLPVRNAIVTVNYGETDFVFTESNVDSLMGYYINDQIGNGLKYGYYKLTIEHEGEIFTARSEHRPVPEIDSITVRLNFFSLIGLTDENRYDIYIHFSELQGKGDHYLVDTGINGRQETARPAQKTVISDESLEKYVSLPVATIIEDDIREGDILTLKLRSISREQYEFYQIFFFQTDLSGNPFAGAPPANIPTNLSEGARGFFQVSSVTSASKEFRSPSR
jgi:hypothetical protein